MIYKILKRILDLICAILGIIGSSPLWIISIVGILISDRGPIFYTAHRIGKDNKPFKMYKFRSMRVSKEPKEDAEASLRPEKNRIFPFGHFIRKVKIDELPQLLNILYGTMSFIGPRPVAKDQFDMFRYSKWDEAKNVPVGLSGPAALYDFIYGDKFTDAKEYMEKVYPTRRELEYTYVKKASFFYDLKMIIYTIICIVYAIFSKEATWILKEFLSDAKASNSMIEVMPQLQNNKLK